MDNSNPSPKTSWLQIAILVAIAMFIGSLILMLCGCTNADQPAAVVKVNQDSIVAEPWHCTPIAPLPALQRAVGGKGKQWQVGQVIKVGFIGGTTAQRDAAKAAFAEWTKYANVKFEFPTTGLTNIRVSFDPGSAWSYIGIDCNAQSQSRPTMNLGFANSGAYYHEIGHALSLLHEHQFPNAICWDATAVIADVKATNGWTDEMIKFNILDYHNPANVIMGQYDPVSIMHYAIPAKWTCDKKPVIGGTALSPQDKAFIGKLYPYPVSPTKTTQLSPAQVDSILNILATRTAKYQQFLSEAQADYVAVKKMLGR